MIAFCACSRFSASSKITECGPSMTSFVASSSAMRGQAVHEERVGLGVGHQRSFTW
jgi:hypothetical protein